ncbi:MAG: universal stress protein [Actinobacteria bacterium]|nr:universal stress protein [Actinomycetota bacterium]
MTREYQRIFVALDNGDTKEWVARRAIEIAERNNAALLFGHVVELSPPTEIADAYVERAETYMLPYISRAHEVGVTQAEFKIGVGLIHDVLFERLIKPFNPDLIICGNRGLSSMKYLFIGKTSQYIIENAQCDVLVIKKE